MKKFIVLLAAIALLAPSCRNYEKVSGDPMDSRIYTLDNGLKVYMTVNKDEPRVQTYIAVRVGGKNDPSDNTGLAHYLEHMMFKGTEQFGTTDYEAEKPMLDAVDSLFEVYRTKTDQAERLALYHKIDSISFEASKLAIPNEYDKLMTIIGSEGTNAFTSNDVTCYTEDIPSNRIEQWAEIEADRFKNCVFRGFHTELEAVYEEKNMSLADDFEKALDAVDSMLYRNHPYGTQTVIGTQDHLKNPSLRTIRSHKDTYYVPNNVAICLSGDFDPDATIEIIKKYFGDWQPNPELPEFSFEEEAPAEAPMFKDVYGQESEYVMMGWRTPGESSPESLPADLASSILFNGMAGLIDLDLVQQQKVLEVEVFPYGRTDYGTFIILATAKEGQSLDEVRDLILAEVDKLRKGEFSDELVKAAIENIKKEVMVSLEDNSSRAMKFVRAFVSGISWKDAVAAPGKIARLSREDVAAWAAEYLKDEDAAVVYKHTGDDNSIKKIEAPKITPILTNRDLRSDFLSKQSEIVPEPIEPVFVDYEKDMEKFECEGLEVLYKKNERNSMAYVSFVWDTGSEDNPLISLAGDYIDYLGTADKTAEEIAMEMYSLASEFNVYTSPDKTTVYTYVLGENTGEAIGAVWDLMLGAQGDEEILKTLVEDKIKERADAKLNQRSCYGALRQYFTYGPEYIRKTTLSNDQLLALTPDQVLEALRSLTGKRHYVLYYGPASKAEVETMLKEYHPVSPDLEPVVKKHPGKVVNEGSSVIIAPYKTPQFYFTQYSNRGETFSKDDIVGLELFNEYFGGGMNTIVFQEMRESRALAYSAYAYMSSPSFVEDTYSFIAFIASQNDKLRQAVEAFDSIINDMPESQHNLDIAKAGIESRIRTERTIGYQVLSSYLRTRELGLDAPIDKYVYEGLADMDMEDLVAVQKKWIKGRSYTYAILGDPSDLDLAYLRSLGPVKQVTLEEIFGF
ncbi:MAG: insulinase family protein [Bacteroidales bacterium]|nr:insulinase family protein [Bacteroidales bacterium]